MNIGIIPGGIEYLKNNLFDETNTALNRDNCHEYLILFRMKMSELGHVVSTYDMLSPSGIDLLIVYRIDYMISHLFNVLKHNNHCKIFYMMSEPPIISKLYGYRYLKEFRFDRIFAWDDMELRKSKIMVKLNYVNPKISPGKIPHIPYEKKKFIATIAGNKSSKSPNELYSERLEVAKFFSLKKEGFSLYGKGWNHDSRKWINEIWKGEVTSKLETLKHYRFALCFENSYGYHGYITEKIFDAFAAGSVPVYYGAPNISEYIPVNTFIDYRNFGTPEKLHLFLTNVDEEQYERYLNSIKSFLISSQYDQFCSEAFTTTILSELDTERSTTNRNYINFRLRLITGLFGKWRILKHIKRYILEIFMAY